jgi:hypothetical protein
LLAGFRDDSGDFRYLGGYTGIWSGIWRSGFKKEGSSAPGFLLSCLGGCKDSICVNFDNYHKEIGFSVRCVKSNQEYIDYYANIKYNEAVSTNRVFIRDELSDLGTLAQLYYRKPTSMGGGGNTFTGWTIPTKLVTTQNGTYKVKVSAQKVTIVGTSNKKYKKNFIQGTAIVTPTTNSVKTRI